MSQPSGRGKQGGGASGDSWEQRAAGLANEVQRWLIKTSARNMRDELGDQVRDSVRKAFRSQDSQQGDVWATATTEPPPAADQPPECAWCPICRAARRMAEARAETSDGSSASAAPGLSDIADALTAAARGALAGIDSILSYRPPGQAGTASGRAREPEDEPDDRG